MPLTPEAIESKIQVFLKNNPQVLVMGYFGSYSKGSAHSGSDIDLCMAEERAMSSEIKIKYLGELTLLLKKEVDLVDLHSVHGVILKEALHDAKWISKNPLVYAQILKRMLFEQADFNRYYERILKEKRERFLKS